MPVPLHGVSNDTQPKEGKTCYNCKVPWSEGHTCKPMKFNLVEDEEIVEDNSSEIPSDAEIVKNSDK